MLARKDLGGNATWGVVILVLVTCLFYEWIRPLMYLTETYTLWPFLLLFFIVMLMQWLASPWWLRLPIYIFIAPTLIYMLYFRVFDYFSLTWIKYMYDLIQRSVNLLLEREMVGHPAEVATLLFLLVIGLAAVNIYNLVIVRQNALFFMLLTAVYVAVLDTFTPYSGMSAIFRTLFFGLVLLAIIQILRVLDNDDRSVDRYTGVKQFPFTWLTVTLILIFTTTSFAFIAPKAAPAWPDPVSFLQGYSEYGIGPGGPGIRKIGYGDNDSRLGGPFEADDTAVFTAVTNRRVYWRGESRDVYTGHGWESSDEAKFFTPRVPEQEGFLIPYVMYEGGTPTEELGAKIEFDSLRYHQVFYPGQPEVLTFPFQQVRYASLNSTTGKVETWQTTDGSRQVLTGYQIASQIPVYSTKALLESSMDEVPALIRQRYTQLPDNLPQRIYDLAEEIAEGAQSDYEIVRRVERYFRQNGYEYETQDVPVPRADQDYVDQFLFDSKRGYCDNFSSSMAVLLRTLGIPTRWVKGFTFGEMQHLMDGIYTTNVTNNNAHSWVEVYFPEVGWVTFEPTRTFSNPYRFERDDLEQSDSNSDRELDYDPLEELLEDLEEDVREDREDDLPVIGSPSEQPLQGTTSFKIVTALVLFLIALMVLAVLNRRRLLLSWALYRYKQGDSSQAVMKVYEWLIAYLGRFVEQRKPSQTMREYVEMLIEKTEATEEVQSHYRVSTKAFEELRYNRQDSQQGLAERAFNSWRDLIKRLQQ